jgi:hypothetical protein
MYDFEATELAVASPLVVYELVEVVSSAAVVEREP